MTALPVVTDRPVNERSDAARIAWIRCLSIIEGRVTSLSYKTWFQPVVPVKLDGTTLTVRVPSQFFYDWLEEHYNDLLQEVLTEILGSGSGLFYVVEAEDIASARLSAAGFDLPPAVQLTSKEFAPHISLRNEILPASQHNLNPRYTFENFIKGDSNQLARAAALAVANNPGGTSFNPFVIYGGTGLGKTHLMHALGNHAVSNGKAKRVVYVSSEKFTIDFVDAIQYDKANEFSQYYRSMDLLIVDDIQFFSGKEKTQDNFFHTFNTLYQLGRQIVLSSDVPPKELKGLDERLISRFQCGLTADIQPPDLETRIAILQKKSQENGLELSPLIIDFIAANVTTNIRELEGCLISLLARASLENREINLDLAKDVLKVVVSELRTPVTIEKIQRAVCDFYNLPDDLLRAKTRKQEIVEARQVAMYLAKELTNSSLKTIGLHFGGRDHSTVIHAYQTVEDRMRIDSSFRQQVVRLQKSIEQRN